MKPRVFIGLVFAALSASTSAASPGIQGQVAPPWKVSEWFNTSPEESSTVELSDFDGKVVYLYCFQSWCPGCHSSGFPTLTAVHEAFKDDPDVAFVAVQTVFEGYHANTLERAIEIAKKYSLTIPIGHEGSRGKRPELMASYRTGGTPRTIIIDREGAVRFNGFHIKTNQAIRLIEHLKQKPALNNQRTSD